MSVTKQDFSDVSLLKSFILLMMVGIRRRGYHRRLYDRIIFCEVGATGYLTPNDYEERIKKKLNPLNRFEKWLFAPIIQIERGERRSRAQGELLSNDL